MNEKINNAIDLGKYSSMRTGGSTDSFHLPLNLKEFESLCSYFKAKAVIGNGTNTIFADRMTGIPIICTRAMRGIHFEGHEMTVEAGASLVKAIGLCCSHGLKGLEDLGGIPGTIGAAIWGNCGIESRTIASHLATVTFLDKDSRIRTASKKDLSFSYRSSTFKEEGLVVLSAAFILEKDPDPKSTLERIEEARQRRRIMGQYELPSCGSFFKNPVEKPAWKLIDEAGMAGMGIGGALVHPRLTNFICNINDGTCTTADIVDLARLIQWKVYNRTRILLEPEVQAVGFDDYPFYRKYDFA
ncbi:MAG: UDP-N-acetylmuramate dehydrogenase [Sphaerochaetaceae bacterium]|jgi:UDP-N-acetylmuramate dehydrogenase|nr:UDP-N-acetylmuramate dehydrogenase [Sphaerochaetaceae bacterium]